MYIATFVYTPGKWALKYCSINWKYFHQLYPYLAHPIPQLTRPITWNLPLIGTTRGLPLSPWNMKKYFSCPLACKVYSFVYHLTTISASLFISSTEEVFRIDSLLPESLTTSLTTILGWHFWSVLHYCQYQMMWLIIMWSWITITMTVSHLFACLNHDWHFSAEITWTRTSWHTRSWSTWLDWVSRPMILL